MQCTPLQFQALVKDWEQEQKQNHYHFADLMALIANTNRNPRKRSQPYTAQDFAWDGKKKRDVATTDEEIYEMLRTAFPPEEK